MKSKRSIIRIDISSVTHSSPFIDIFNHFACFNITKYNLRFDIILV